jgi:translation elongation factor EF-4
LTPKGSIRPGQIGYVVSNMKQVKEARIGDTFHKIGEKVTAEPGFKPAKPMMFAGVYPLDSEEFNALEKKYHIPYTVCKNWY